MEDKHKYDKIYIALILLIVVLAGILIWNNN